MARYFMSGTRYARAEREMMRTPNHNPRGSGAHDFNKFKYTKENTDCNFCTEYKRKLCTAHPCPWITERIEAGVLAYDPKIQETTDEVVQRLEQRKVRLDVEAGTISLENEQRSRILSALASSGLTPEAVDNRQLAALYLLSSNRHLWVVTGCAFTKEGIKWHYIRMDNLAPDDYVLLQTAKAITDMLPRIGVDELADEAIVSDEVFCHVFAALRIARNGANQDGEMNFITDMFSAPAQVQNEPDAGAFKMKM